MDRRHPDYALKDYFDDLLGDLSTSSDAGREALSPKVGTPEASLSLHPAQQSSATTPLPYAEQGFSALERTKREKLQALLNSKPLAEVPTIAPVQEDTEETKVTVAPVELAEKVVQAENVTQLEQVAMPEEVMPAAPAVSETVKPPAHEDVATPDAGIPDAPPVSQYLSWHDNGRPHWAQGRFDALLFDVAGLKLAVPLIALGQIQPLTDELTPLFGQAAWFMGLLPTPAGKIRTVNTALFVMPEKYDPKFRETAKYVVSIDGVPWGLAVDAINQPVTLYPEDVKWRSERSKRPWLAGTVKSAMCALIDIPQMGKMLTDADANAR